MTKNQIFAKMVAVSNNSRITQATADIILDKLDPKELEEFYRWLQIIEREK